MLASLLQLPLLIIVWLVVTISQNSGMHVIAGQYKKNEQWRKITYVGGGVAGKCYLAVDIRTEAQFAVKKVTRALPLVFVCSLFPRLFSPCSRCFYTHSLQFQFLSQCVTLRYVALHLTHLMTHFIEWSGEMCLDLLVPVLSLHYN